MSVFLSDPDELSELLPDDVEDDDVWWGNADDYEFTDR